MATDYILFVHGVKNRNKDQFELQAQRLFEGIRHAVGDPSRQLKPIFLFWGDLNVAPQKALLQGLKASSQWSNIWFQDFRSQEILEFVGDAALYLSRHIGSAVICLYQFRRQTQLPWRNFLHPGDPIAHLLEGVIPTLLGQSKIFVDLKDVVSDYGNIWNLPFQQSLVPLLWGGDAHGSYWTSKFVMDNIGDVVRQS